MNNKINITKIVSSNCGGYGAWMGNPLSSAAPGEEFWGGFQLGGGRGRGRRRKLRRLHKSRKNKKRRQIKTRRH